MIQPTYSHRAEAFFNRFAGNLHGISTPTAPPAACSSPRAAHRQPWRWTREKKPEATSDELRLAWRQAHLKGVVCGGWIQAADGEWEEKKC